MMMYVCAVKGDRMGNDIFNGGKFLPMKIHSTSSHKNQTAVTAVVHTYEGDSQNGS